MATIVKTKYVCDLCKREFAYNVDITKVKIPMFTTDPCKFQGNREKDLCKDCEKKLAIVIKDNFCYIDYYNEGNDNIIKVDPSLY